MFHWVCKGHIFWRFFILFFLLHYKCTLVYYNVDVISTGAQIIFTSKKNNKAWKSMIDYLHIVTWAAPTDKDQSWRAIQFIINLYWQVVVKISAQIITTRGQYSNLDNYQEGSFIHCTATECPQISRKFWKDLRLSNEALNNYGHEHFLHCWSIYHL